MGLILALHRPEPSDLDMNRRKTPGSILQSLLPTKAPISLEGYLRRTEMKGFMMFSQSYNATTWIAIPVGRVRELEWMGPEANVSTELARVRLII